MPIQPKPEKSEFRFSFSVIPGVKRELYSMSEMSITSASAQ